MIRFPLQTKKWRFKKQPQLSPLQKRQRNNQLEKEKLRMAQATVTTRKKKRYQIIMHIVIIELILFRLAKVSRSLPASDSANPPNLGEVPLETAQVSNTNQEIVESSNVARTALLPVIITHVRVAGVELYVTAT